MRVRISPLLGRARRALSSARLPAPIERLYDWVSGGLDKRLRSYILLLVALAAVTLFGTVAIFRVGTEKITGVIADFVYINEIDRGVDHLVGSVSQTQMAGLAFRSGPSARQFQVWETHLSEAKDGIARSELASTGDAQVIFADARTSLVNYEQSFRSFAALMERSGYSENDGLQGSYRSSALELEKRLREAAAADALGELLTMRKLEKNFILRAKRDYIEQFEDAAERLTALLTAASLSDSKHEAQQSLARYRDEFLEYTRHIDEAYPAFAAANEQMKIVLGDLDKLIELTHGEAAIAANKLLAARQEISTTTLLGITFLILFVSGLLAFVVRRMGQLTHEAQLSSRTKSEFLSVMSHELRTPLNAIIGFSDIMKAEMHGPIGAQYKEYLVDISTSGHHLLQLINDILEFARMDRNASKTNLGRVSVSACVRRAERFLATRALSAGVKVTTSVEEGLTVVADEAMLRKMLVQLIDNAIKFTPAGGRITVWGESLSSGSVTIRIEDTGIGIPKFFLNKVTQPFFQVAHGHTRRFEGKGLGLAIVKQLVEINQGHLEIDSEEGKGTRVTLTLPGAASAPALSEVA
jgi:signal transduction histidine kinase